MAPQDRKSHGVLINAYLGLEKTDEAKAAADDYLKAAGESPEALVDYAGVLGRLKDKDGARAALDRSIALKPTSTAYYERSRLQDNGEARLADLDRAVALAPDDTDLLYRRAAYLIEARQYAKAQKDLDAGLAKAPEDGNLLFYQARLLAETSRYPEAVAVLDRVIKVDPGNVTVLNERCWTRGMWGRQLDQAMPDCDAAVTAAPKSGAIRDSRGLVHLRAGRLDKAIADYDAALALEPDTSASMYGRGIAKLRKGDRVGGQADLEAARKMDKEIAGRFAGWGVRP
jgi:tetratricopeptide (TPR) repeat protein